MTKPPPGYDSVLEKIATAALERDRAESELRRSVLSAVGAGVPQRQIASVLGVSQPAVSQMVAASRPKVLGHGPLGRRLVELRQEVLRIAADHGVSRVRVFGSVAAGRETDQSDVDLLVETPGALSLIDISALEEALAELLDADVDVVPESFVKPDDLNKLVATAIPL
jgi:predicted nucleotidyltransferase